MSHPERSAVLDPSRPSQQWLVALQTASDDLSKVLDSPSDDDLARPSLARGWSVAEVLSHLGSGAEICAALVRRGLAGEVRGPQRAELLPIWERWNALGPAEQRDEWKRADRAHLALLASISGEQENSLRVPYFAGPMDLTTYVGYRLSEHALHGWDVAAAYEPAVTVGQLDLVWQRIDMIASRFHDSATRERLAPRQVSLRHDGRHDRIVIGEEVRIGSEGDPATPTMVTATTDVLTRLVYGRLRAEDRIDITGPTTRDDLTQLFPGF